MEQDRRQDNQPSTSKGHRDIQLVTPSDSRLHALMGWFGSQRDVASWGGPTMRWPVTLQTLKEDARLQELASFFLVTNTETLGFGQFYRRLDRCHLGRLAIAPEFRGQHLGHTLIERLAECGHRTLATDTESLFVLEDNAPAIRLYQRCGFLARPYPGDDLDLAHMTYMVRESDSSTETPAQINS